MSDDKDNEKAYELKLKDFNVNNIDTESLKEENLEILRFNKALLTEWLKHYSYMGANGNIDYQSRIVMTKVMSEMNKTMELEMKYVETLEMK